MEGGDKWQDDITGLRRSSPSYERRKVLMRLALTKQSWARDRKPNSYRLPQ
jgi:hypothetical protein